MTSFLCVFVLPTSISTDVYHSGHLNCDGFAVAMATQGSKRSVFDTMTPPPRRMSLITVLCKQLTTDIVCPFIISFKMKPPSLLFSRVKHPPSPVFL